MIIIDTDVLSELMKPAQSRSPSVTLWMRAQQPERIFTTTITLAEILAGIAILPDGGGRKKKMLAIAEQIFSTLLFRRILSFDEPAARVYADIVTERRKRGLHKAPLDFQIAAVAKARGMSIATRNTSDFEGAGIEVINPWSGE
ncbi:MAG: type II toxin-antitoxin system VapC family toxin [Xanthobacteraceae bacterium]